MTAPATLRPELHLLRQCGARLIAGVDEVGRGALAGPVTVGVAVIDLSALDESVTASAVWPELDGVKDSKLLSAGARQRWEPVIREHVTAASVQHQSPDQIDARGITAALGEAGRAGLRAVEADMGREVDAVILDGIHDWLTHGTASRVHTMAKADTLSLSVACASVLAKVTRDAHMTMLAEAYPDYGWHKNKGYGAAVHREALRSVGVTPHHRRSWNLGVEQSVPVGTLPGL